MNSLKNVQVLVPYFMCYFECWLWCYQKVMLEAYAFLKLSTRHPKIGKYLDEYYFSNFIFSIFINGYAGNGGKDTSVGKGKSGTSCSSSSVSVKKAKSSLYQYPNKYTCWKFQCGVCVQLKRNNLFAFFLCWYLFCFLIELIQILTMSLMTQTEKW